MDGGRIGVIGPLIIGILMVTVITASTAELRSAIAVFVGRTILIGEMGRE